MMRDSEKTIGNLIDKQSVAFIASVSEDGFPNTEAIQRPAFISATNGFSEV